MPTPKKGEKKQAFLDRCMAYPDMQVYDEKQRYAICESKWDQQEEKKSMEDREELVFEVRALKEEGKSPRLVGYAAVFNKWSEDLGGFKERVAPGAFTRTLKTSDVRAFYEHDLMHVLGRQSAKTLRLKEDDKGLYVEIEPPDAQWTRDLMVSIDRGDISSMSFGFRTVKDSWDYKNSADIRRTLVDVDLRDVSIVSFPAYKASSVALRHLEEIRRQQGSPLIADANPAQAVAIATGNADPIVRRIKEIIARNPV